MTAQDFLSIGSGCRPIALCLLLSIAPLGTEAAAMILNPSFEDASGSSGLTGWSYASLGAFTGRQDREFVTEGAEGGQIYSRCVAGGGCPTSFSTGDFGSFTQTVDLTEIDLILVDLDLQQPGVLGVDVWDGRFEASVLIDSTPIWASTSGGVLFDVGFDTSPLLGMHDLEFRVDALVDVEIAGASNHFNFDNLRVFPVPEPSTALLLTLGLAMVALRRPSGWGPAKLPGGRPAGQDLSLLIVDLWEDLPCSAGAS